MESTAAIMSILPACRTTERAQHAFWIHIRKRQPAREAHISVHVGTERLTRALRFTALLSQNQTRTGVSSGSRGSRRGKATSRRSLPSTTKAR